MATTWNLQHPPARRLKGRVQQLLESCEVQIDGSAPHDIQVLNEQFYARVLSQGSLGLGESYMQGWWEARDLEGFVYHLLVGRLDERVQTWSDLAAYAVALAVNLQRRSRAFEIGRRHYDLGNDLYERMLDPLMIYSCGYWERARTLADAQLAKLDLVFGKLGLRPGERVLDVGCGWGGALRVAAERHGVQAVGITVSRAQAEFARRACAGLPVEIRLEDYRDLHEPFDHLYSIGMFEHVGVKNYRRFFEVARRCLRPGGRFLLHTIGARRPSRSNDPWIEKYIFPNSRLPDQPQLVAALGGRFAIQGWQCIGAHYVPTLREWLRNFELGWPALRATRDERFYRMWRYYLCSSAASFRAEKNDVWQVLLTPI